MADLKVGDVVRLTGEGWRYDGFTDPGFGQDVIVAGIEPCPGFEESIGTVPYFHVGDSERKWWIYKSDDRDEDYSVTLVRSVARVGTYDPKRDGRIIPRDEVEELGKKILAKMNEEGGVLASGKIVADTVREVRTTSSTGGEKGVKPEAFDLIPWDAMDEVARVYDFGSRKYAAHNWRKGYEWNKSFAAACRHMFAFWRGEDRDPETGTLHVANAVFHMLALITFALDKERYGQFDNRYTAPPADSE